MLSLFLFSDLVVDSYKFVVILMFILLNISNGLVMMNSFSFILSGKHFICPSFLNNSFAGQSNLGCRSLLFITLNTSS